MISHFGDRTEEIGGITRVGRTTMGVKEFGSEGLSRKTTMKFTVIRAPSPYNVILGRSGLKALRAIPSTIHAMMKFPTPRGIATLITRSTTVSECRKLEDKQVMCDGEGYGRRTRMKHGH
ncbi:hypothetical protein CTI12_AA063310 [Artemisia annua]|uniref:Reverse transcriptase domain-containing protein n=1 Tax=Artemisia annua TaxID=35608 RepID=A0A2U1P0F2_ARTAN|nr:hypothetical protein CTI12_AA063310 [Artemisia annua]